MVHFTDEQNQRLKEIIGRMQSDLELLEIRQQDLKVFLATLNAAQTDPKALGTLAYIITGTDPTYKSAASSPKKKTRGGHTMSAAGRERVAIAQRARWAKSKAASRKLAQTAKAATETVKSGMNPWDDREESIITKAVDAAVKENDGKPISAADIARTVLAKRFPQRTAGGIRQHMIHMVARGLLTESRNGSGSASLVAVN